MYMIRTEFMNILSLSIKTEQELI